MGESVWDEGNKGLRSYSTGYQLSENSTETFLLICAKRHPEVDDHADSPEMRFNKK